MSLVRVISRILVALPAIVLATVGWARVVWIDEGGGNGFLFHHAGNCYVILPAHVHERGPMGLSARDPAGLGVGRIIYTAGGTFDLALAVVSGSLEQSCGREWLALPSRVTLDPGADVTVIRYQKASIESVPAKVRSVTFTDFQIDVDAGDRAIVARNSGATVFQGDQPVGMVIEVPGRGEAVALRMDEIRARLRRVIEDWSTGGDCVQRDRCDGEGGGAPAGPPAPVGLGGFKLKDWSTQGTDVGVPPDEMLAGKGVYVAPIGPNAPVVLLLEADKTTRLSRVVLTSDADGVTTFSPKRVLVRIDPTADGIDRWRNFLSPRDMVSGQPLDLLRSETFARRIEIRIRVELGRKPGPAGPDCG